MADPRPPVGPAPEWTSVAHRPFAIRLRALLEEADQAVRKAAPPGYPADKLRNDASSMRAELAAIAVFELAFHLQEPRRLSGAFAATVAMRDVQMRAATRFTDAMSPTNTLGSQDAPPTAPASPQSPEGHETPSPAPQGGR